MHIRKNQFANLD